MPLPVDRQNITLEVAKLLDRSKVKIGISPIGWTNDDLPELGGDYPVEKCLDEMSSVGFEGCEVGTKYPRDPARLKALLEPRGLQICSAWISPYLTTKTLEENRVAFMAHAKFLSAMGAEVMDGGEQGLACQGDIDSPVFANKPQFSTENWKNLIAGLNELGKQVKEEHGITFCYHHHMGTGVQTMEETDRLLNDTKPEYVMLNYDTGHFLFAGEDPLAAAKRYVGRIGHVHVKDVRLQVRNRVESEQMSFLQSVIAGVYTVPGDGAIDFGPIFQVLAEGDYRGWILVEAEQDPAKAPPLLYAEKAWSYLENYTL